MKKNIYNDKDTFHSTVLVKRTQLKGEKNPDWALACFLLGEAFRLCDVGKETGFGIDDWPDNTYVDDYRHQMYSACEMPNNLAELYEEFKGIVDALNEDYATGVFEEEMI